ncbi:unnamed protein product [Dovyalis caffra]|uniref:RRM domain-containing protein n=1 Tax=Dovyalis caffra TaxID=77055 RepID=A0AAV1RQK4_9ROSI|nr:unnamed protein product [Dovyalis caffra]
MEFDEIEYLEKTVEEAEDREDSRKKNNSKKRDGIERSYRKREVDDEDIDNDEDRKVKKSKAEDENGRDRHRKHRDSDRDRSSREKDRDRESSRREKEKERERREKEKDRERRERREREMEREEVRDRRERSRSRSRRRFIEKKEVVEPEVDPERDQRTVFAYQMPLKATERDVYEFFSKAGKLVSEPKIDPDFGDGRHVRDVRLIMDRNSRRSKGVGYVALCLNNILVHMYSSKVTVSILISRIKFNCILKCTSNAIMMRDDGNTLHSLKRADSEAWIISPGVRYVEFYDAMSVPIAIALSGQLLFGQLVMVKPSEAEKNLVQSSASGGSTVGVAGPFGSVDRKLYVGNLHFNMTEMQLRQLFEPFGTVELVQLPLDLETGQCKGFGFVQVGDNFLLIARYFFTQLDNAKAAQSALNGKLEIAGRTIKVSSVTEHGGQQDSGAKSADFDDDDGGGLTVKLTLLFYNPVILLTTFDTAIVNADENTKVNEYAAANLKILHAGNLISPATKFDDLFIVLLRSKFLILLFEGTRTNLLRQESIVALNAQSRALLMQKLDRTGSLGVPLLNGSAPNQQAISLPINGQTAIGAAAVSAPALPYPTYGIGQPSECLLLKNMFDPATETEPDFDLDIKEDVEEECSKYGRVEHICVDKNSAGCVYLRFDSMEAAARAQRAMHMRWFARRSILAVFMRRVGSVEKPILSRTSVVPVLACTGREILSADSVRFNFWTD